MKITAKKVNEDYLMEAKGSSGISVFMDSNDSKVVQGTSPMELLLMGVAGCSAIDIVYLLNKQREVVKDYSVEVEGERHNGESKPFKNIALVIKIDSEADKSKVIRAAQLSFDKYCSVALSMKGVVNFDYKVFLNNEQVI
jgi:putative redox protein